MGRKENGTTSDEGRSTVSLENEEHSDEDNTAGPSGTISAFAQIMFMQAERTSRSNNPRTRSLAIPHGMGSVVVTFRALRIWSTSVNDASTPACSATSNTNTFPTDTNATFHHLPFAPLLGKATSPRAFNPAAALGKTLSKSKNKVDGTT